MSQNGHFRAFTLFCRGFDFVAIYAFFCVIFLGQKLRLRKFVDKYHVWSTSLLWINIILVDRHQYCDISEENDQHKYNHLDPSGWHPVNWSMATILSVIQTNDLTRCGFICSLLYSPIQVPRAWVCKRCISPSLLPQPERCHYWHRYRDPSDVIR